ncbi:MAG: D-alanyl-D-alanine carboxypeptidase family protein, partial [bacterium]
MVLVRSADAAQQRGDKQDSGKSTNGKQRKASDRPRYGTKPPKVDAKAWVLIDARDGEVLAARSADSERLIASTTKMMTAYVASQLFEPRDVVRIAGYRASPGESLAGLEGGDRISVRDLLYALLLPSGNDAAYAVSRIKPFTEKRFVAEMNASARDLGLVHTSFSTPIGLDERANYSSARDLAELARALLGVSLLSKIVDTESRTVRSGGRKLRLLNRNSLVLTKPWVSGVKTGYTSSAGY